MTKDELVKKLLLEDEQIRAAVKSAIDDAQSYAEDGEPIPERFVAIAQVHHILDSPDRLALIAKEYGWVKLADDQDLADKWLKARIPAHNADKNDTYPEIPLEATNYRKVIL